MRKLVLFIFLLWNLVAIADTVKHKTVNIDGVCYQIYADPHHGEWHEPLYATVTKDANSNYSGEITIAETVPVEVSELVITILKQQR